MICAAGRGQESVLEGLPVVRDLCSVSDSGIADPCTCGTGLSPVTAPAERRCHTRLPDEDGRIGCVGERPAVRTMNGPEEAVK